MSLTNLLANEYRFLRFKIGQRIRRFSLSPTPGFASPLAVAFFTDRLRSARRLLEYGCGSSTMLAASIGTPFHTIDSDRWFLDQVRRQIRKSGTYSPSHQSYEFRNIGRTGRWGFPHCAIPAGPRRLRLYARYSDPPDCQPTDDRPDLVLIDGRFRLACALKAVRWLEGATYHLVVDDYASRPYYHALDQFATVESLYGDTAVFSPPGNIDHRALDAAIRACETDPR